MENLQALGRDHAGLQLQAEVDRLRGTVHVEYSLAKQGAEKLWKYLGTEPYVNALGALTGNQAMQQVKAGLKGIYLIRLAGGGGCELFR